MVTGVLNLPAGDDVFPAKERSAAESADGVLRRTNLPIQFTSLNEFAGRTPMYAMGRQREHSGVGLYPTPMGRADMKSQDVEYYQERAEQELERALAASHPLAVSSHYRLSAMYLDLVHDSPARPTRPRNALQN